MFALVAIIIKPQNPTVSFASTQSTSGKVAKPNLKSLKIRKEEGFQPNIWVSQINAAFIWHKDFNAS